MEVFEEELEHFYHHTIRALTQAVLGIRDIEMNNGVSGEDVKKLYYKSVKRFVEMVGNSAKKVRAELPNDNDCKGLSSIFDGYIADIEQIKQAFESKDYAKIESLQQTKI